MRTIPGPPDNPRVQPTPSCWTAYASPIGTLTLIADADAVTAIRFATHRDQPVASPTTGVRDDAAPLLRAAVRQLDEYFAGRRQAFGLPLRPLGTPFQRRVWDQLCGIPYGQTISYAELARRAGDAKASRAVGAANGRNPIGIVIPCHRVIAADGQLGGFGGGLETKRMLLNLEGWRQRTERPIGTRVPAHASNL